ncbi:NAD(P)H-hydrate dehydratase [Hephaestia mangrovi]|uniref:NAD(P)H-hydrate dehydratase n=1 Tax=Hephaestia mangrovi TaxID=2873268 RepID=UPI001CA61D78|nr:NAD(P)H-hydrate dehydratase [Hephaestia mangrovi]MBY8827808.1 NAD(P)H-hydrate dehydratase [Hephaestia mangrovi]
MTPIAGKPVVTAAEMRAAENCAIAAGTSADDLMERAGKGIAAAVHRLAAGAPVLVLCGPGNNGGDGYVAATALAAMGHDVRIAAMAEPSSDAAKHARAAWTGPIESIAEAKPAPVLLDALFGTGLSRGLDDTLSARLCELVNAARLAITVDLPSGVATDDGTVLSPVPDFEVTLTLGAVKPAHLLQPAARHCGAVRLIDIGIVADSAAHVLGRPNLPAPSPDSHKYNRGMVVIVGGPMRGAALLASTAAMRAGAGYVALLDGGAGGPHALVHRAFDDQPLDDDRIGALLIGPGLGRNEEAAARLDKALASDRPLIIDGDALHLLKDRLDRLRNRPAPAILTPHEGEFTALFGKLDGSKLDRARTAARQANAILVYKGADTVIAAPDGRARLARDGSDWLSTAGTGDVLAGTIAATLAADLDPLEAAAAGVWLHGEAARRLGASFIADDLANALTAVRASL